MHSFWATLYINLAHMEQQKKVHEQIWWQQARGLFRTSRLLQCIQHNSSVFTTRIRPHCAVMAAHDFYTRQSIFMRFCFIRRWRCCGVLEYSLDSHTESPGLNLTIAAALLSFSKAIYPHCCSRPRCINGDPVGCDRWLCLNLPAPLSQAAIPGKECSPEIMHCQCGIEMYPMTGVIIICCKRFGPYGKSAYKN